MKDDSLYLIRVRECIHKIEKYTTGGRSAFLGSELIQDAVICNLQTMAEASQRVSETRQAAHPEVEWFKIAGFRNILAHDYLGVDMDKVWEVVEHDLPPLKTAVENMLGEIG
ncbi:MAG: DUF86 domain-containing protein [Anaerolineales bacterium]|nr:DUF86 domain-containing protein [Anaerolineales bacterium]